MSSDIPNTIPADGLARETGALSSIRRSLLRESLETRRRQLETLILPSTWQRIGFRDAGSADAIEEAFHAARRAGNEGLKSAADIDSLAHARLLAGLGDVSA